MAVKPSIFADLRLEATLLTAAETAALVEASLDDGFSLLALNRTLPVRAQYTPVTLTRAFDPARIAVLQRVTLQVSSEEELKAARARVSALMRQADLVAIEFTQPEPLEAFLRSGEGFGDDLLSIDVRGFAPSAAALKQLLSRPFFVEVAYAPVVEAVDRRKPLTNLLRVLDSHLKRLLLSSAAATGLERRSVAELREFLRGLGDGAIGLTTRLPRLCADGPCEVVQRARFRREGFATLLPSAKQ